MADINKSFELEVIADLSRLQSELAKIPGYTEKSAASAALKLEQQFLKGTTSVGKAGAEAGNQIGAGLEVAHKSARKLGGALSIIDPQLGAMVREVGHFAGGLGLAEGAGASLLVGLGAVAIAVAGLVEVWKHYGEEAEKANKKAEESAVTAAKAMIGVFEASDKGFLDAQKSADEANQNLIDLNNQQERIKNNIELTDQTRKIELKTIAKQIEEAEREKVATESLRDANKAAFQTMEANLDAIHDKKAEGAKDDKKATDTAKEQARAEKAAHAQYIDDLNEQRAGEKALRKDEQRIEKERAEAAADAAKEWDKQIQAQADAEIAMYDDFVERQAKEKQIRSETTNAAIDSAQQLAMATTSVAAAMFGDMKELAIAEAIINTAVAVVSALKNPPGPPFSTVNAIAAGAMGAAQVAKIASTNIAHSGLAFDPSAGSRQAMAPDEQPWKLRKNEGVLTERGVRGIGGYSQVRKLNAGQSPSMGSSFVGITQFKHKMLDATIGPNIARPAAARTEIKAIAASGGRVGHRLRSNT